MVVEAGVCRRLVELLNHASPSVQTPALRTVGKIVTEDAFQAQAIIDVLALPSLLGLLSSPKKGIRKEACWTISNITAGNRDQIQAVIEAGIVPPLLHLLGHAEFDIKKEAAWAVCNATSGGAPEQIKFLVQQGCIPPLCELLVASDAKIVNVALEGLENILKVGQTDSAVSGQPNYMAQVIAECDGLTKIEGLQQHETESIYNKSVKILETYFGAEEEEDTSLAPQVCKRENRDKRWWRGTLTGTASPSHPLALPRLISCVCRPISPMRFLAASAQTCSLFCSSRPTLSQTTQGGFSFGGAPAPPGGFNFGGPGL